MHFTPSKIIQKASKTLVQLLVFLLPIYFLPFTSSYFEFNKQILLWLVVLFAYVLWLSAALLKRKIVFRNTLLHIPILIFLVLNGLSVLFSKDWYSSFFGSHSFYSGSYLGLLVMVLLFYLILNLFNSNEAKKLYCIFLYSIFISLFLSLLSFLGVFGYEYGNIFVNLSGGSLSNLGVLSIVLLVSCLVKFLYTDETKDKIKQNIFYITSIILSWLVLAFIGETKIWLILIATICVLLIVYFLKFRKKLFKHIGGNISLAILLISLFVPVSFLIIGSLGNTQEINNSERVELSVGKSYRIVKDSLASNAFFGNGQGTFDIVYSRFRGLGDNFGEYWQYRFGKSGTHFFETLSSVGILGLLSWFLLSVLFIYLIFILYKSAYLGSHKNEPDILALYLSLLAIFISQFFITSNTTILFAKWLIPALVLAIYYNEGSDSKKDGFVIRIKYDMSSNMGSLSAFLFVYITFVSIAVSLAVGSARFLVADMAYARGVNSSSSKQLERAAKLNPSRYQYHTSLSRLYLKEALVYAGQGDIENLQKKAQSSLDRAKYAVRVAPFTPISWETLGMVYRDVNRISSGGELLAINAFAEALDREPTNPVIATEIGKLYSLLGENNSAIDMFDLALKLKYNYAEANFHKARAMSDKNNYREALELLYGLLEEYQNSQLYYEVGRLHFNLGELDLAKNSFLRVLEFAPGHSNALYSLGLIYEIITEFDLALDYFNQALLLNPNSEELINKIKNLSEIVAE